MVVTAILMYICEFKTRHTQDLKLVRHHCYSKTSSQSPDITPEPEGSATSYKSCNRSQKSLKISVNLKILYYELFPYTHRNFSFLFNT